MNDLPQELVDRISSYLSRDDLKNTLFLSRYFQYAAEEQSRAFSEFVLTRENADQFLDRYSGRLFRLLQNVEFETSVPALKWDEDAEDDADCDCRDTAEQLQEMDREFTRQIKFLFYTIRTLETRVASAYGPGKIELKIYTPTREVERPGHCLHRVFTSWRVHLLDPEVLPNLTSVRSFMVQISDLGYGEVPDPSVRKIDLRILLDISNKLPNLDTLKCKIGGDEWARGAESEEAIYTLHDWEGPRRDSRRDFSKALETIALPNLRHAQLDFIYPVDNTDWIDQRITMPDMVSPAQYDLFSSSLRMLSYQLRSMKIRVVADETLFWPVDGSTSSWPNLENLSVMFHMATPSGKWYFQGPPGLGITGATEGFQITEKHYPPLGVVDEDSFAEGEISEDYYNWDDDRRIVQYRIDPINQTLVPFLTAFAKAAASMPSLRQAALWSPLSFQWSDVEGAGSPDDFNMSEVVNANNARELAWGLAYTKPGEKAFDTKPGQDYCNERQMWWKVRKWRPDPELHELFQQIGRREHGAGMTEYWTDEWFGEGLVDRAVFDDWEGEVFGYD